MLRKDKKNRHSESQQPVRMKKPTVSCAALQPMQPKDRYLTSLAMQMHTHCLGMQTTYERHLSLRYHFIQIRHAFQKNTLSSPGSYHSGWHGCPQKALLCNAVQRRQCSISL